MMQLLPPGRCLSTKRMSQQQHTNQNVHMLGNTNPDITQRQLQHHNARSRNGQEQQQHPQK